MQNYIIKTIIRHYHIILSLVTLISAFLILLFLYNNIYETQNDIAEIYTLKGQLNTAIIDTKNIDFAYESIEKKTNRERIPTNNIRSPF